MKKNAVSLSGLPFNHSEELLKSSLTGTSLYSARAPLPSPLDQSQVSIYSTLRPPSPFDLTTTLPSTGRRRSPTPQHLTPPLLDSDEDGPPYLPGPDDLVSLDMHTPRKNWRSSCRDNNRSLTGELHPVPPLCQNVAVRRSTSDLACGREAGTASAVIEDTTVIGSSTCHNIPTNGNLFALCKSSTSKDLPCSGVVDMSATSDPKITGRRNPRMFSSSCSIGAVPESLVVKHSIPIQSRAHTYAWGYPGNFEPGNRVHHLPVASWMEGSERQTSPSRPSYQCQNSTRDRRHATPASITLRKASEQYGNDFSKRRSLQSPACSESRICSPILRQRLDGDTGSCGNTSSPSFNSFGQSAMKLDAVLGSNPGRPNNASLPLIGPADEAHVEGQRSGTGMASTVEVHDTPRAFSFPRTPRTSSSLAIDTIQPKSVQVHPAGSLHRVIWAPDDTRSSSISQDISWQNGHHSGSGNSTELKSCGSTQPETSPSRQEVICAQSLQLSLAPSNYTTSPLSPQIPTGMLDWDWQAGGHHKETAITSSVREGDQIPPTCKRLSRTTQPGRWSRK